MKPCAIALIALLIAPAVIAQQGTIHRCIGENGEPTYSDQACVGAALPARPQRPGASGAEAAPWIGAPITTQTCAVSPEDLRNRVARTFATHNDVGFSGLFLWDGFGHGSSLAPLRELARMIAEPLIAIDLDAGDRYPAQDRFADRDQGSAELSSLELRISTVAERARQVPGESVSRFALVEQAGCWWLQLP